RSTSRAGAVREWASRLTCSFSSAVSSRTRKATFSLRQALYFTITKVYGRLAGCTTKQVGKRMAWKLGGDGQEDRRSSHLREEAVGRLDQLLDAAGETIGRDVVFHQTPDALDRVLL